MGNHQKVLTDVSSLMASISPNVSFHHRQVLDKKLCVYIFRTTLLASICGCNLVKLFIILYPELLSKMQLGTQSIYPKEKK